MNSCTIYGRLGKDAVATKTSGGANVLKFSVANDTGYGENKKTNWFNCSLWGSRGEKLEQYLLKGTAVVVTGEVTLNTYENKEGVAVSTLNLNVRDLTLAGKAGEGERKATSSSSKPAEKSAIPGSTISFDDDDIPF
jgi:single-strand DNA-binding protein